MPQIQEPIFLFLESIKYLFFLIIKKKRKINILFIFLKNIKFNLKFILIFNIILI